jgi:hypothetical protein
VEAYFPDFGWVTFDPTPASPQPAWAPGGPASFAWLYLDALNTYWQDWIVQYDLGRQLTLARSVRRYWLETGADAALEWRERLRVLGERWRRVQRDPGEMLGPFVALLAAAGAAAALVWLFPGARMRIRAWLAGRRAARGAGKASDCAILLARALDQMRRRGFPREKWQTPEEFAAGLEPGGPRAAGLREITAVYYRARFGGDGDAARRLPALIRSWESLP